MPTTATRLITAAEFLAMPNPDDGLKYELFRGEIVTVSRPHLLHGFVQINIGILLGVFAKANRLGRVYSESGVVTERDPDSVRGPDMFFYRSDRLPDMTGGYPETPPDLVVEVLSPSDRSGETRAMVQEYLNAGVPLVWVVDPEAKTAMVYRGTMRGIELGEADTIDGGEALPGFTCTVADFFAD